jgi:tetratricopeptide (TPR) repeat protein
MNRIRRFILVALGVCTLAAPVLAQDLRIVGPRLQIATPGETPVELRAVRIATEIDGVLAITSVEMVFHNPNRRVLEGELQFPLLEGQSVVGFALDVDGRMRDAVPIDKARGQAVFEDITRARVDPGLLQATEGNNYKVRVYPIPADGTRRILVRYVESLGARGKERVYRLPLAYARGVRDLFFEARVEGEAPRVVAAGTLGELGFHRVGNGWRAAVKRSGAAGGMVELAIPERGGPRASVQMFRDAAYFHAEGRVRAVGRARTLPRVVQLAWDSSGSMAARDFARERVLLDAYFGAARDVEVHLVRVRDAAEPSQTFRVRDGDWSVLRKALEETAYDGGTNLAAIPDDREAGELLLFSDGLANFGDGSLGPRTIPVFVVSSVAGAATGLRHIAESGGGRFIDLLVDSPAAAREKLLAASARIAALDGDGVRDLVSATSILADGRFAIAGIATAPRARVRVTIAHSDGRREVVGLEIGAPGGEGLLAATTWAAWRLSILEADYDLHRAEIRRLGRAFGLVTRETSLIVLERVEDYVRHEVEPPAELADAYARLRSEAIARLEADRHAHVERIVQRFREKQAWWDRDFPKDGRPVEAAKNVQPSALAGVATAPAAPAAPAPSAAEGVARLRADAGALPEAKKEAEALGATTTIRLRPWRPDAPYAARMREAGADRVYRVYLDERPDYVRSSAFFLDAADILIDKGRPELAVRVLSNLAEMDLENRHLLRILGYRLLQAKQPRLAIPVFRKVLVLAPEEPQSYRDLGLAYDADRQFQKAVDQLAEVVMRPWHGRFPEIELIALAELNAIVANAGQPLDVARLDPRLARNLPLDLRVVLTWDADNTDIDLWVTDPNGEKAYYGHRLTYQGGRMSLDFTGGYGPEEFSLKSARPGVYKVEANFYGHRQQTVAGATTLQVKLTTRFGTPGAEERIVTLRLKGAREMVYVGDFEVR